MEEFGIHPYYLSDAPVADLVLVHGLMGHSTGTWTGEDDKGQPTYWPDWIRERRPDVNIWLADYDSSLHAWAQPAMPLDQIGGALLMHARDQGFGQRPIHWVGHSMGGLIIKHLLRQAREKANSDWHALSDASRAITFLGTPHQGSDLAKWEEYFSFLLSAWDVLQTGGVATGVVVTVKRGLKFLGIGNRQSHVQELRAHGKTLGDLNDAFAQWLGAAAQNGSLLRVRNYYETRPVFKAVTVVPKHCAQLSNALVDEAGVQANHFAICKFASPRSVVFDGILKSFDRLVSSAVPTVPGIQVGKLKAERTQLGGDVLISHLTQDVPAGVTSSIPLDHKMLRHQADDAIKSLRRASAYWTALQTSENLNNWWKAEHLVSPQAFVESLLKCPPETKPEVMSELSAVFKDRKSDLDEKALGDAAAATVACFLLCACSVIKADAHDAPIALPSVSERNAAHLLASLIAVVMTGGRLELRQGDGVLPRGSGTHRVQSTGVNAQFDFERQLYSDVVRNPWSVSSGQKTGGLSDDERNELLEVLRNRRGYGVRTKAMCFIIDSDEMPISGIDVAREIGVPVFHASAEVVEVIFGVDKATLVTQLKQLWTEVCAYQSPDAADAASP